MIEDTTDLASAKIEEEEMDESEIESGSEDDEEDNDSSDGGVDEVRAIG